MNLSLLSALRFEECKSQLMLEAASASEMEDDFRCEVTGATDEPFARFVIRKRKKPTAMFLYGDLYPIDRGRYKTLITYAVGNPNVPSDLSYEEDEKANRTNMIIATALLIISSLCFLLNIPFVLAAKLNAFTPVFILVSFLVITLSFIYIRKANADKRQRSAEIKALVDFIKELLQAA